MDFTSSLDLGNSILANIANAERNYAEHKTNDVKSNGKKPAESEIVEESPTNKSSRVGKSFKENSRGALTKSRCKRRARRKNKSDSILHEKPQPTSTGTVEAAVPQLENVSDYFKSPMEIGSFNVESKPKEVIYENEEVTSKISDADILLHVPQRGNISNYFGSPLELRDFTIDDKIENITKNNRVIEIENKRPRLSDENPKSNEENPRSSDLEDIFAESMEFAQNIRFSVQENVSNREDIITIDDSSIDMRDCNEADEMLMERPICGEDIKDLGLEFSADSEALKDISLNNPNQSNRCGALDVKDESFQFVNKDIENFVVDMSTDLNFDSKLNESGLDNHRQETSVKLPIIQIENIINTEDTSFLGEASVLVEQKTTESKLIPSKKEIVPILRAEESNFKDSKTSVSQGSKLNFMAVDDHKDLSKCSSPMLNWSISSDSESPTKKYMEQESIKRTQPDPKLLKDMTKWGLPTSITREYKSKGIREMFDWQVECLINPKVLFEHSNLVYSAPTSAGKTLVSEFLTIKTVLERKKKALIILPFISVVREKMSYLQDLLTSSGYRVDGFFGGYSPPGGFENINVAICTIEKANSIINKLLENNKLNEVGIIVVDEIHLISDPGRGYILELLLAKVTYMCRKYGIQIQIVSMSATLSNIVLLQKWLQAEFYVTNYRPVELQEMIKVGTKVYNNQMELIRELNCDDYAALGKDSDQIAQLCVETILIDCSVIVFCPSKDWCETLCLHLAESIMKLKKQNGTIGQKLDLQINKANLDEVKIQLKNCTAGLDTILAKSVSFGCAFHHAGLTTEERDIIEMNFKTGALKILVATSTLSSGVNLPARRVIIRSPLFAGKKMNSLTYKQMIGRAGRTGKDTLGESILICTETNIKSGKELVCSELLPIKSCLSLESSMPLKRALLEVIASGIATTKEDVKNFLECTLLHVQNLDDLKLRDSGNHHSDSGSHSVDADATSEEKDALNDSLNFLIEFEFIRLQMNEETNEMNYVPTRLGMACLSSSLPPNDGLLLFSELQKSRRCFVLETELHAVYLVTPYSVCYQINDIDWLLYLDLHDRLSSAMKRVAELVGVKESFLVKAMRGNSKLDYKTLQIHKRFYTAMALQELVNEVPLNRVSEKYKCSRGLLQSLQQMSSTFAGIVTSFCNALNWTMLALIVGEFKERLFFGVHRDLIDLMRIPDLNGQKARALFNAGITSLVDLANADSFTLEKILFNSVSFDSEKKRDDEDEYDTNKRNLVRCLYITGRTGLTVKDVAKLLISNAQQYLQHEIGVENVRWNNQISEHDEIVDKEENEPEVDAKPVEKTIPEEKEKPESLLQPQIEIIPNKPKEETQNESNKSHNESVNQQLSLKSEGKKPKPESQKYSNIVLRKSPRNHRGSAVSNASSDTNKSPSLQTPKADQTKLSSRVSDIFNDSTFDINSQMAIVLDKKPTEPKTVQKVSQKITKGQSVVNRSPINKSIEEIIESQTPKPTQRSLRSNATRTARAKLTQRRLQTKGKNESAKLEAEIKKKRNASSSIEISDCASSSLLKNPMQLNSSSTLEISENVANDTPFKCLSIIDICGNETLFHACMEEINKAKCLGLSIAVEKLLRKSPRVIGAELLGKQTQNCKEETDTSFIFDDDYYVAGISLCIEDCTVMFLSLQTRGYKNKLDEKARIKFLLKIVQNEQLVLRIFDAKEQLKVLRKCIPELREVQAKIEDPKIAHWLLQPDKTMTLKNMVEEYAPELSKLTSLAGSYAHRDSIGLNANTTIFGKVRASVEACVSLHILGSQVSNLERIANGSLKKFFDELEMPVQYALAKMEAIGFPVDEEALGKLSKHILDVMKKLEKKMYQLHGSPFNAASASAVARVLGLHRKPNGRFSTAKEILEKIDSPMSIMILNYRKLGATLNKTIQPLIQFAKIERIHGNSISFTSTGRISMHEPNLQNVANDFIVEIDAEDSYLISCRSSFSCVEGKSLISVDYCQLEMRILTHLSQDDVLMKIMRSNEDIFRGIAAQWNKIPQEEISERVRNGTKQICYGVIYGMGLKSLASSLKCDIDNAAFLVEQFHSTYPGIRQYTNKVIKYAQQNGYVETITGRRRYLPNITSPDASLRVQAERQALNTTIQGSAADIAKKAILRTEKNIVKYCSRIGIKADDVRFVLHLHDELLFEVPENKVNKIAKVLRVSLENSAELSVPLRVKIRAGKSWGTLQEI